MGIESGNFSSKDNQKKNGWIVGHFMDDDSIFHSNDVEIKWGMHKKGWKKSTTTKNPSAKTISILIDGRFLIGFPDDKKEVTLSKKGDYVLFGKDTFHFSEALEDTTIVTIRWPSLPDDVVTK